jgi:triacylglycerol lipase
VRLEGVGLPLWREAAVPLEWLRLRLSRTYRGRGVPRGDGSPVVVIPGFLCPDFPLVELTRWLCRIGYRAQPSGITVNAGCLDRLGTPLAARIERLREQTGERVHLVGHSLGGLLARNLATLRPDLIASVVALGSPVRQLRAHSLVVGAAGALAAVEQALPCARPSCLTPECACPIVQAYRRPLTVMPFTAVYTRGDGIVDWRSCSAGDEGEDVEVGGSHIGLMYNPDAYRAVAEHLARAAAAAAARRAGAAA